MTSAVAPLKYPHFRSLWAASIFSASGSFIQSVAASWLMFEMTGSNTWVGMMVASATLPLLFVSLAAGALADMFDRTKLMLIAQTIMGGSAAAMAVITYLGSMTPEILLGLGLLLGTGLALNIPAWQALIPDLVPRGLVASAVALQSVAFNSARAVGPAIGGLIILAYGPEAGFGINALSYLAVIVVLIVIGPRLAEQVKETASFRVAIKDGLRFARSTKVFRNLMELVALFAITSAVVSATLPVHTDKLGGSEATFGLLLGAMGAGALAGAFARPTLERRIAGSSVPWTIGISGVAGLVLAFAPSIPVAGVGMFLFGLAWLLTLSTLRATAQLLAPGLIRGRAMSLYTLAFAGILPLGSILSGLVADQIGTSGSLAVFSSGAIVIALVSPRFGVPSIDDIEDPDAVTTEAAASDQD
ncbi:MAG: MFS transporter [Acidimicrobiia bacterium]|nr:MFS transporter [Acidimicrobiia bacterium]